MLQTWLKIASTQATCRAEVIHKLQEWFTTACATGTYRAMRRTSASRFRTPGKYFYVWVDAPIGYWRSFRTYATRTTRKHADAPLRFEDFTEPGNGRKVGHGDGPLHRQGHHLFPHAVLAGDAARSGLRTPTAVHAHGFITVDGAKMSKSRGTFIKARTYLDHLDPEYLRYYLATLLGPTLADIDLDLKAFEERVNSHVVGKWVNIASRTAGFVHKFFGGRLADALPDAERVRYETRRTSCARVWRCTSSATMPRRRG